MIHDIDQREYEIQALKSALRDVVRERDINITIVLEQNKRLLDLCAQRKALIMEVEILKMYLNWGGNS